MNTLVSSRTVLGAGDATLLVEVKGMSVRLKRRGFPEVYLPLEVARDLARLILAADAPDRSRR